MMLNVSCSVGKGIGKPSCSLRYTDRKGHRRKEK